MPRIAASFVTILLLMLSACSSSSREAAQRVTAAAPPPAYIYLASGKNSDEKNITISINFEQMAADGRDSGLTVTFGMLFAGAVADAVPTKTETMGSGQKADDPIKFPATTAEAQLNALGSYLADRFPKREQVVGHLFRGPDEQYVVRAEFNTRAGANSLYFDVTEWALRKNELYQN